MGISKDNLLARGFFILFSSNVLSQTVNILVLLLLTKKYDVKDFGSYAVFSSYVSILSVLFTLKYDSALVIMRFEEKQVFIVHVILLYMFFLFFFLLMILKYANLLLLSVFCAFSVALYQMCFNYFLSFKWYKFLFFLKILFSFLFLAFAFIVLKVIRKQVYGIIYSYMFAYLATMLVAIIAIGKHLLSINFKLNGFKAKIMLLILKKYKSFPFFYLPQQFLNQISNQMPILLISYFFGNYYSGIFLLTMRLLSTFPSLAASSMSQVFYQQLAELYQINNTKFRYFFFKVFKLLCLFSPTLILSILLVIFLIKTYILSKSWSSVFLCALILSPMVMVRFIGSIASVVVLVLGYQKYNFYIEIVHVLLRFFVLCMSAFTNQFYIFLSSLVMVSSVVTGYKLFWYNKIVRERSKNA